MNSKRVADDWAEVFYAAFFQAAFFQAASFFRPHPFLRRISYYAASLITPHLLLRRRRCRDLRELGEEVWEGFVYAMRVFECDWHLAKG